MLDPVSLGRMASGIAQRSNQKIRQQWAERAGGEPNSQTRKNPDTAAGLDCRGRFIVSAVFLTRKNS